MQIPVIKRTSKKEFNVALIDLADVLHVFTDDNVLRYQMRDGVYSQISTLEEMERYLTEIDLGFLRVERGYIAQVGGDAYYDEELHALCYARTPGITAPVARSFKKVLADANVPIGPCQAKFTMVTRPIQDA